MFLATGEDYGDFADGAYIPLVRDTWQSLVVPNHHIFISLLIAFETGRLAPTADSGGSGHGPAVPASSAVSTVTLGRLGSSFALLPGRRQVAAAGSVQAAWEA